MIKTDENALICDLAETYHIYNYRQISPKLIAIYAVGLSDDSRIKMKLSGAKVSTNTMLMMAIVDSLNYLLWSKTKDGAKGINRPKSIFTELNKKESDISAFNSGKDFEEARAKILGKRS